MLREQLDEETGIRGYGADRNQAMLQPYYEGRLGLPRSLSRLTRVLERLGETAKLDAVIRDALKEPAQRAVG